MGATYDNLADSIRKIISGINPAATVSIDSTSFDGVTQLNVYDCRPWPVTISIFGAGSEGRGSDLQILIHCAGKPDVNLDMFLPGSVEKLEAIIRELCGPNVPVQSG